MLKSYVGIASRHGLEVFVPEHDHVLRFLARRSRHEARRRAVCFWAVLPQDAAFEVRWQMESGVPYAALLILDRTATDLGAILPAIPADLDDIYFTREELAYRTPLVCNPSQLPPETAHSARHSQGPARLNSSQ